MRGFDLSERRKHEMYAMQSDTLSESSFLRMSGGAGSTSVLFIWFLCGLVDCLLKFMKRGVNVRRKFLNFCSRLQTGGLCFADTNDIKLADNAELYKVRFEVSQLF